MKFSIDLFVELTGAVLMSVPALGIIVKKAVGGLAVLPRLIPWPRRRFDGQVRAEAALLEVSEILVDLEETIEGIRNRGSDEPWNPDTANERLDEIVKTVNTVIDDAMRLTGQVLDSTNETPSLISRLTFPTALQLISQYSGGERARVFMSTGLTFDTSGQAYWLQVRGNKGSHTFGFASGTTQASIIDTINMFSDVTGVIAKQHGPAREYIRIMSEEKGRRQFVGARKASGAVDNILYDENGSNGANRQYDFGK